MTKRLRTERNPIAKKTNPPSAVPHPQPAKVPLNPTVTELSQLAATLVAAQDIGSDEAAEKAHAIWTACQREIEAEPTEAQSVPPPDTRTFPVPLAKFLLDNCLSARNYQDRCKSFREYLEETYEFTNKNQDRPWITWGKSWEQQFSDELPKSFATLPPKVISAKDFATAHFRYLERLGMKKYYFDKHLVPFKCWEKTQQERRFSIRGRKGAQKLHASKQGQKKAPAKHNIVITAQSRP